ncbi:MAG: DUF4870 domain-containing protein [Bacteroidetes bacterium]|nr:DUF4870 domain-containing protein [Bacteroidota bacterium]
MEEEKTSIPSNEEKLISLLSHLSIFFGGLIVPIVLWAIYKEKSKYVRFQSLQTIFFHLSYIAFIFVIIIFVVAIGIIAGVITQDSMAHSEPPYLFIIPMFLLYGVIILSAIAVTAYSTYMGVKAYQGEIKKYLIVGNIIYNKVYKN